MDELLYRMKKEKMHGGRSVINKFLVSKFVLTGDGHSRVVIYFCI